MKAKFLSILGMIVFAVTAHTALDDTMVLYLSFDEVEGKNVIDLSNHGNNATLEGKSKIGAGKFGNGTELTTGAWLVVKDHDTLDLTTEMTISLFAKLLISTGDHQSGVEKEAGWGAGEYNLLPEYGGGVLWQAEELPDECDDDAMAGPSIIDKEWHHVAGTWDGKMIRIYVDGEERRNLPCKGELSAGAGDLFIGSRGGSGRWVEGFLDEIKMYNRPLTEDEIKQDMIDPAHNLAVSPRDKIAITWGSIKNR